MVSQWVLSVLPEDPQLMLKWIINGTLDGFQWMPDGMARCVSECSLDARMDPQCNSKGL